MAVVDPLHVVDERVRTGAVEADVDHVALRRREDDAPGPFLPLEAAHVGSHDLHRKTVGILDVGVRHALVGIRESAAFDVDEGEVEGARVRGVR